MKPIIRWVGGKTRLLTDISARIPTFTGTYYEPFVGGGSLVFRLLPPKATVADKSSELINFYTQLKNNPDNVCDIAATLVNDEPNYYDIRAWDRVPDFETTDPAKRAARYLYLSKTGFNGLMRVNAKTGHNNTPWGHSPKAFVVKRDTLTAFSREIQGIDFRCGDFTDAVSGAVEGDFVYFDPPYFPTSSTASYTGYTLGGFTVADQQRLHDCCVDLDKLGIKFLLSNSDCAEVRQLYSEFIIDTVSVGRSIAAKRTSRGTVSEVLVRNYAMPDEARGASPLSGDATASGATATASCIVGTTEASQVPKAYDGASHRRHNVPNAC